MPSRFDFISKTVGQVFFETVVKYIDMSLVPVNYSLGSTLYSMNITINYCKTGILRNVSFRNLFNFQTIRKTYVWKIGQKYFPSTDYILHWQRSLPLSATTWPFGKLPFDCQKIAKNLTFFQKNCQKFSFFSKKLPCHSLAIFLKKRKFLAI